MEVDSNTGDFLRKLDGHNVGNSRISVQEQRSGNQNNSFGNQGSGNNMQPDFQGPRLSGTVDLVHVKDEN